MIVACAAGGRGGEGALKPISATLWFHVMSFRSCLTGVLTFPRCRTAQNARTSCGFWGTTVGPRRTRLTPLTDKLTVHSWHSCLTPFPPSPPPPPPNIPSCTPKGPVAWNAHLWTDSSKCVCLYLCPIAHLDINVIFQTRFPLWLVQWSPNDIQVRWSVQLRLSPLCSVYSRWKHKPHSVAAYVYS